MLQHNLFVPLLTLNPTACTACQHSLKHLMAASRPSWRRAGTDAPTSRRRLRIRARATATQWPLAPAFHYRTWSLCSSTPQVGRASCIAFRRTCCSTALITYKNSRHVSPVPSCTGSSCSAADGELVLCMVHAQRPPCLCSPHNIADASPPTPHRHLRRGLPDHGGLARRGRRAAQLRGRALHGAVRVWVLNTRKQTRESLRCQRCDVRTYEGDGFMER